MMRWCIWLWSPLVANFKLRCHDCGRKGVINLRAFHDSDYYTDGYYQHRKIIWGLVSVTSENVWKASVNKYLFYSSRPPPKRSIEGGDGMKKCVYMWCAWSGRKWRTRGMLSREQLRDKIAIDWREMRIIMDAVEMRRTENRSFQGSTLIRAEAYMNSTAPRSR